MKNKSSFYLLFWRIGGGFSPTIELKTRIELVKIHGFKNKISVSWWVAIKYVFPLFSGTRELST